MTDPKATATPPTERGGSMVPYQDRSPAQQSRSGVQVSSMELTSIEDIYRLAHTFAASKMVPKSYNNADQVFVGIIAGAEVGLAPMQALQSIAVINGMPSIWGDGALALVQASGLLDDIEETDDGTTATCRVVRKGRATEIVRTFSDEDAKRAGLLGKAGPWTQYRPRMRQMRARSWALRDGFADVLKGLHIVEEVRDHPEMADDAPKTVPLSSDMLAQQAGQTIEQLAQAHVGPQTTDAQPDQASTSPEAQQTLDDIDGPLEPEPGGPGDAATDQPADAAEQRDAEPDSREVAYERIKSEINEKKTVIDLEALYRREKDTIEALTDEQNEVIMRRLGEAKKLLQSRSQGEGAN